MELKSFWFSRILKCVTVVVNKGVFCLTYSHLFLCDDVRRKAKPLPTDDSLCLRKVSMLTKKYFATEKCQSQRFCFLDDSCSVVVFLLYLVKVSVSAHIDTHTVYTSVHTRSQTHTVYTFFLKTRGKRKNVADRLWVFAPWEGFFYVLALVRTLLGILTPKRKLQHMFWLPKGKLQLILAPRRVL